MSNGYIIGDDGPEDIGQMLIYFWQILNTDRGTELPPLIADLMQKLDAMILLLQEIRDNTAPPA